MMEHMQSIREQLLAETADLSSEALNMKTIETQWSIGQVMHHIYLCECVITDTLKDQIQFAENKTVPEKDLSVVADRSRKVEAAAALVPTAEEIQREEILTQLEEARRDLLNFSNLLEREGSLEQKALKHPVMGNLSIKQWIEFVGYHEKRHLLQIQELKETLSVQ
ncbi:DinB family protein [Bacillus lacus]|uniref:DinB family protein n=1 Tax=Metabacillus lacus TaxID=1983721 RepID=A0A7X2J2E4_9BACI|nr:DinB family protein [Metabacillus lacus]MRX74096.1 DinB family protein [Metabacillus lacus]